ncbi:hypothetical protein PIB30_019515 [Stylosanthes scabra]|uniref:Uncharacterized protein n=1 Tax=Stylosanthes scabra TaxID=79078 RepID=A0ABU6V792_9FABA|nr:hypothetical protein [Stylosanthes scabra]
MEMQGIPVTIANLAIHRHREKEMNQERMRHNQTVQEAAAERAREENKGKAREVVPDSEEEFEELHSSASEECSSHAIRPLPTSYVESRNKTHKLTESPRNTWEFLVVHENATKRRGVRQRAHVIRELSHVVRELWRPKKQIEAVTPRYTWVGNAICGSLTTKSWSCSIPFQFKIFWASITLIKGIIGRFKRRLIED